MVKLVEKLTVIDPKNKFGLLVDEISMPGLSIKWLNT